MAEQPANPLQPTDPLVLGAQARAVIADLHRRPDVIVRMKSDKSGFAEDATTVEDRESPGHFTVNDKVLTINLDAVIPDGKPWPEALDTVEKFRDYPVLAGVMAHESAHARYDLWESDEAEVEFPEYLPNPDYDPSLPTDPEDPYWTDIDPKTGVPAHLFDAEKHKLVERFPVKRGGDLHELAVLLEEPRIERLGMQTFSKTWQGGMKYSSAHFLVENMDEKAKAIESGEREEQDPLDAALEMAVLVGGRMVAGTVGQDSTSRKTVDNILSKAQQIIETALEANPNAVSDPYFKIMGLIGESTLNNVHKDPVPHLEVARKILAILHPESQDDPDNGRDNRSEGDQPQSAPSGMGPGEGGGSGEGDDEKSPEQQAAEQAKAEMNAKLQEMANEMAGEVMAYSAEMKDEERREGENPDADQDFGGYGAVVYDDPKMPRLKGYEPPTADDRALYKRAHDWIEEQTAPTTVESEVGQWMPTGGARLNVGRFIRDNAADHHGNQRTDWDVVSETTRIAPPTKIGIMRDASGSMSSRSRWADGIAWAISNAAADFPEARTASVVFGERARVTQKPGREASKQVAISTSNGGWENWIEGAELIEEHLRLNDPDDGQYTDGPTNVLIVIVSDLMFGRTGQMPAFIQKANEWAAAGHKILVVGADPNREFFGGSVSMFSSTIQPGVPAIKIGEFKSIELVTPEELFKTASGK